MHDAYDELLYRDHGHEAQEDTYSVVALTSSHEEIDLIRIYKIGVKAYFVKPVDFTSFSMLSGN
jgi:DNA-binding response OmpR family regulator